MLNTLSIAVQNVWKFGVSIQNRLVFVVTPANNWKFGVEQGVITPPVVNDRRLTEDGNYRITENGDNLILE